MIKRKKKKGGVRSKAPSFVEHPCNLRTVLLSWKSAWSHIRCGWRVFYNKLMRAL